MILILLRNFKIRYYFFQFMKPYSKIKNWLFVEFSRKRLSMKMKPLFIIGCLAACAVCPTAFAQDYHPEFDIFIGYSLLKVGEFDDVNRVARILRDELRDEGYRVSLNKSGFLKKGFIMTYTYNVTSNIGLDASFRYDTGSVLSASGKDNNDEGVAGRKDVEYKRNDFAFLAGPRYTLRNASSRVAPFVYGLIGVSRDRVSEIVSDSGGQSDLSVDSLRSHRSLGFAVGGGLDVPVNANWVVRAIQADYYITTHPARLRTAQNDENKRFGNINLSFGIVYRFGN